jgi:hypothetical protein
MDNGTIVERIGQGIDNGEQRYTPDPERTQRRWWRGLSRAIWTMVLCLSAYGWILIVILDHDHLVDRIVPLYELPTGTLLTCAAAFGFWFWYFSMPEKTRHDERDATPSNTTR